MCDVVPTVNLINAALQGDGHPRVDIWAFLFGIDICTL